jgi:ubiquinone/menaquinone biosynthesis C-methylase UbiE
LRATESSDNSRERYNARDVVEAYAALDGLSAAEDRLFDSFLRPGMDVLDLGVGAGRTTRALQGLAGRYVGVDYAERMIDRCRVLFPDADFRVGDAADLSAFVDGAAAARSRATGTTSRSGGADHFTRLRRAFRHAYGAG